MIEVTSPGYPRALRSLAFPVGFVFAVVVHRSLKGVEAVGPRHIFLAFILLYALQGMIVGLRFGYGVDGLVLVQPVTASMMAPLAFLAFRSLAGAQPKRAFLHAAGPFAVGIAVAFMRDLVDPLLLAIFFGYGVALYRLTLVGDAAAAEASLQRVRPVLRAARLTAGSSRTFCYPKPGPGRWTNPATRRAKPTGRRWRASSARSRRLLFTRTKISACRGSPAGRAFRHERFRL